MGFIRSNLLKDEKLIYFTRLHWMVFAPPFMFFVAVIALTFFLPQLFASNIPFINIPLHQVILFICLGATLFSALSAIIRYLTSEFGITNRRLIMKTGWISIDSLELFVDKLEAIHIDQSILGRIFNYGSLRIVGMGGTEDPFFDIPSPLNFRKIALEQINKEDPFRKENRKQSERLSTARG